MRVAVLETVTVTAASPLIDLGRSTVQQTVNEPLVRTLPLLGRNFIHLASLTAGFTGNPSFPSPQGQVFWANNVLVDGASHFSKWRSAARTFNAGYGLESIKEVQVLANRFSAEFGEALATVTSAVTKAGTNEFRGAGLLFVQDDALNATPTFAIRKPPLSAQQFGFTLGGPFVKDRTHFFSSYEGRRSRNHNIVVSPAALGVAVPDDEDEHLGFFRVDHQLGQRQLITARYNGQFFRWHHEIGGLGLPGTGTAYTNDVHTVLVTDALTVSSRLLNESRVQFARYVETRFDLQPTVYVSRAGYSTEGGALGPFGFGADPEDTLEGADTLSFWAGPHTLKSGGGVKYVRSHNAFLNAGRGAYAFAGPPDRFPAPFLFVQGLAPTDDAAIADPRSVSAFGFVQDDWTVRPELTLNLGLRYDIERVDHVRNYPVPVDKNNIQPRLGAAWDPGGRRQVIVRGGVGLYTQQQLLYYINRVQLEGPDGTVTISLSPDSPLFPGFPNGAHGAHRPAQSFRPRHPGGGCDLHESLLASGDRRNGADVVRRRRGRGGLRLPARTRSDEPHRRECPGVERQAGAAERGAGRCHAAAGSAPERVPENHHARQPGGELVSRASDQSRSLDRPPADDGVVHAVARGGPGQLPVARGQSQPSGRTRAGVDRCQAQPGGGAQLGHAGRRALPWRLVDLRDRHLPEQPALHHNVGRRSKRDDAERRATRTDGIPGRRTRSRTWISRWSGGSTGARRSSKRASKRSTSSTPPISTSTSARCYRRCLRNRWWRFRNSASNWRRSCGSKSNR